ncbi:hypothetical protein IC582_011893 [Cucumis melo]|uniref:Uncharacterized protein LOC127149429 n=1 Tax=Cucumis melo TaxID=3656 RepID=A0A9I9CJD8_CUCME|nr:uncharacterized protein LOC127149429 [Cucumis melo]
MLLRSPSTLILNPWKPHFKESSTETVILHQFPKSRLLTLSASSKLLPVPHMIGPGIKMKMMGLCCGVDDVGESSDCGAEMVGGFVDGKFNRDSCNGNGNGNGGDGGCFGSWDGDHTEEDMAEMHFQRMIKTNPKDSLLLSNYAQFLKEVRGDLIKAEEYCGRAMLARGNNGSVISMYAELIWSNHMDASRAESYHLQATKTSPDNSFVFAAYARFLWEVDKEVLDGEALMDIFGGNPFSSQSSSN